MNFGWYGELSSIRAAHMAWTWVKSAPSNRVARTFRTALSARGITAATVETVSDHPCSRAKVRYSGGRSNIDRLERVMLVGSVPEGLASGSGPRLSSVRLGIMRLPWFTPGVGIAVIVAMKLIRMKTEIDSSRQ